MTAPARRFTRSTVGKRIGGVCGGIAEYSGWSSGLVRLLFAVFCVLPGPSS
ncbi:PspC domain-containing protein [Nocardia brevicatena]|uniref:PspC domain-containing protein n=1 Tax=Nocardia brevicatena TaxID=37327 RepID=UPI0002E96ECE